MHRSTSFYMFSKYYFGSMSQTVNYFILIDVLSCRLAQCMFEYAWSRVLTSCQNSVRKAKKTTTHYGEIKFGTSSTKCDWKYCMATTIQSQKTACAHTYIHSSWINMKDGHQFGTTGTMGKFHLTHSPLRAHI